MSSFSWILTLLTVFGIDIVFTVLLLIPVVLLAMLRPAAFAVLKRNFVGYFSNPTGYVFLVLFVLMTSFAAFWPHEFFTNNLANLDQLNIWIPLIMLVFIPAITMSTWAEERRQGTDELLLTLPAADYDIVWGKYLAASAIFTVSLLFSQLSHISVLVALTMGDLDVGLLMTTYFGYWLMGLAMLAIGMVASFFTNNLTIAFVLGAVLNAPLAFASVADMILSNRIWASNVRYWSLGGQFDVFGRGLVTASALMYFVMIICIGLYLSMVLIGRRHWLGGRDGHSMLGHYLLRIGSLFVFGVGLNLLLVSVTWLNLRADLTENQAGSLSKDTRQLLGDLDERTDHPVVIEAFISPDIPPDYIQTRYDLVNLLKEFQAIAGRNIEVRLHENVDPVSTEASLAEERFGIRPQTVVSHSRGAIREEQVILGAAFSCGLERVVVPFFDYGMPVEYELIRSVVTVAEPKRKRLGILTTDAQLYGGFTFTPSGPSNTPKQAIVDELEKQYDVEQVDPQNPIEVWVTDPDDKNAKPQLKYDVLLAVQPSSLEAGALDNLIDAIRQGQPTAIFEDPLPQFLRAPGTGQPKQNPMAMFGGGPPPPKGDITRLWSLLGIDSHGEKDQFGELYQSDIVWQKYNPYRVYAEQIPAEWVFIRPELETEHGPFNEENPITSGLEEVLLPYPGAISHRRESSLSFTPLMNTGAQAGTIKYSDIVAAQESGGNLDPTRFKGLVNGELVLAASIQGKAPKEPDDKTTKTALADDADADKKDEEAVKKPGEMNVVYVADIDVLSTPFVNVRARPNAGEGVKYRFDNVTFVLNVVDQLAGEKDFLEIRKRKTKHNTLRVIERADEVAREKQAVERKKFDAEFEKARKEAEEKSQQASEDLKRIVDEYRQRIDSGEENIDREKVEADRQKLGELQAAEQLKYRNEVERLEKDRDKKIADIRRELDRDVLSTQYWFKFCAVVIPWILPALVGLTVFVSRVLREREGITKSRLR